MSVEEEILNLRTSLEQHNAYSLSTQEQLREAIARLSHELRRTSAMFEAAMDRARDSEARLNAMLRTVWERGVEQRREFLELSSALTLGLNLDSSRITRSLPIAIYLSVASAQTIEDATHAMHALADALDFQVAAEYPEIQGSWYKRLYISSKQLLTQPEVAERLERLERAAEIRLLDKAQAEVDGVQSGAIAKLIKALDKVPNAAVQAGSVLVVKLTTSAGPVIQARTLTQHELEELESNQLLLQEPHQVLARLADACNRNSESRPRVRNEG